jgi:hypothetical protein
VGGQKEGRKEEKKEDYNGRKGGRKIITEGWKEVYNGRKEGRKYRKEERKEGGGTARGRPVHPVFRACTSSSREALNPAPIPGHLRRGRVARLCVGRQ